MDAPRSRGTPARPRRNAMLHEEARKKIQTTQLINRLQNHAMGKIDMSPTQVRSVEILLRKCVPDLQNVALTGEGGGPVLIATGVPRDADD